jgi:hypothetical protein
MTPGHFSEVFFAAFFEKGEEPFPKFRHRIGRLGEEIVPENKKIFSRKNKKICAIFSKTSKNGITKPKIANHKNLIFFQKRC